MTESGVRGRPPGRLLGPRGEKGAGRGPAAQGHGQTEVYGQDAGHSRLPPAPSVPAGPGPLSVRGAPRTHFLPELQDPLHELGPWPPSRPSWSSVGRGCRRWAHPGRSKGAGSRASCQSRREETWGPEAGARDKALRLGSGGESASPGGRPGSPAGRKELEAGQTLRRERGSSPQVVSTFADSGLAASTENAPLPSPPGACSTEVR